MNEQKQNTLSLREFCSAQKRTLLFIVLAVVICWAQNAFTGNVRIDGEHFLNNPGTLQGWLSIGRFGMLPVKLVLGNINFNPYFSGALFIVFFSAVTMLWLYLFKCISPDLGCLWVFAGLFVSSNTWAYMFYFTMMSAEIAFALLIIVCSLIVFSNYKITRNAGTEAIRAAFTLLLVIAFGCYQAVIPVFVSGAAICILLWLDRERERGKEPDFRAYFYRSLNYVLPFAAAFLLYSIVSDVWFTSGEYLSDMSLWQTNSVSACLLMIAARIAQCIGGSPNLYSFAFLFGFILFLCFFVCELAGKKLKSSLPLYELTWAVIIISPFIILFRLGGEMVPRMQFSLQTVAAFMCMYFLNRLDKRWIRAAACAVSVILMAFQFSVIERLYYTDDVRAKQDEALAFEISSEIEKDYGQTELPVVFVGRKDAALNKACLKTDVFGASLFSWDYTEAIPSSGNMRCTGVIESVTGAEYRPPSDEQLLLACIYADEMPSYPQNGYIAENNGMIVVKLSD